VDANEVRLHTSLASTFFCILLNDVSEVVRWRDVPTLLV